MNSIPSWIDREAWDGFIEMRSRIKRPLTGRAVMLLMNKLIELRQKGHDANACLDQSTLHNWQTVYPVKTEDIPNLIRGETQREAPMTPEEKERADEVRRRVMSVIKLVKTA